MAHKASYSKLRPKIGFLQLILVHNPNGILIASAAFAQGTAECPYILRWDVPFPPKLPLPMGDLDPI